MIARDTDDDRRDGDTGAVGLRHAVDLREEVDEGTEHDRGAEGQGVVDERVVVTRQHDVIHLNLLGAHKRASIPLHTSDPPA